MNPGNYLLPQNTGNYLYLAGGANTGQTSGWFRVPALQTVTVTYSVAPTTFQWFGD